MSALEGLRTEVLALAATAGRAIMEVYAQDFSVSFKPDHSPLTAADLGSQSAILAGLRRLTPEIPVLSEESSHSAWDQRRHWNRMWLVDPLDGTREFIKRNGEFCVAMALIEHGAPLLGVIHAPVSGATWSALRGQAAYRREADASECEVRVAAPATGPLRVASSRSHADLRASAMLDRLAGCWPPGIKRAALGSALKFCRLAEGALDLYPRFGPTCEWDTAAGQCILEAAGGAVLGLDGRPLRYNQRQTLTNDDFIALGDPSLPWRDWLE